LSFFPLMAASVRTRVVSWKDAAERNELVARDALVMPRSTCCVVAASPSSSTVIFWRLRFRTWCKGHPAAGGISTFFNFVFAQHLADNDFNVLVVDVYALELVHSLDFFQQILVYTFHPLSRRMSWGFSGPLGDVVTAST
jgi:hypothetical protein